MRKARQTTLWMLLLPGLMGFLVFYVVPFAISGYYAFIDNVANRNFVGLSNFAQILASGSFRSSMFNTLRFIALCVPLNMVLAYLLAAALQGDRNRRGGYGLLYLLPLAIPSGAVVFFWHALFDGNGVFNRLMYALALPNVQWLESAYALPIVVLVFLWKNVGYSMVLFWAGLNLIPSSFYEYAHLEGASGWQRFRYITFFHLLPTSFLVLIMSLVNSFKSFKEIYLLAGPYPSEGIYMMQQYLLNQFGSLNMAKLSASSIVIIAGFAVVFGLLFAAYRRAMGRDA